MAKWQVECINLVDVEAGDEEEAAELAEATYPDADFYNVEKLER